ncbi:MAG: hypothetical protein KF870_02705 [Leadbetterella sp.]|nr:hypothetical protein [Leadbetterella sp.]
MKNTILLFTGLCLLPYSSSAQFTVLGAEAFGRANSLVAVPGFSSMYQNPGGIGVDTSGFLSFNFLKILPVRGLHTTGVQGVFRGRGFNYGFSVDSFGDTYYRESRAGLALARKQDRVAMGVKISYIGVSGVGPRSAFLGEIGMVVTPVPMVSLGLCMVNFTSAKFYDDHPLPTVLALGAGIYPNSRVNLSGQLDYRVGGGAALRLGLDYQVRKQLGFSAGIDPEMRSVHFGTRVLAGRYGFLYGIATHPYVGIAHHTTFIYKLHD